MNDASPRGLIAWFLHNHVAANILMLLLVVGGIVSVATMRTETFPTIDPRLITISVVYPGATPEEVADAITNRVEEQLVGINGVDRVASTAMEGYGLINVELEDFANADDVYNEVETAVASLSDFPPQDAERAIITKVRVTPNVMTLALHGKVGQRTLKYWAQRIEDELQQLGGVALTEIKGIREYEMSIDVSQKALRKYELSMEDVRAAIAGFAKNVPAGTLESAQGDILLRVQNRLYVGEEFEQVVVRTLPDGSALRLGDIATVVDGFTDTNLISKFNDEPAAFIDIKRSESEDTLKVASAVKAYLDTVALPEGLTLSLRQDETVNLQDRISLMLRNGIIGFMLVFLILLLFLDLKLAFWTSAAIPISFLGGLMILQFMGYSLNMITLFALIVVLGIVVDDGIVTGESIFDAHNRHPEDPNATLRGVRQVLAPVTVGVATTMAAFAPLIFSTGTLGQIIGIIPVVVIAILAISLVEAYLILPIHLSNPKRWSRGPVAKVRDRFAEGLQQLINTRIVPAARFAIRWRYATVAGFIAVAILTFGLLSSGLVRFIFFPRIEGDRITVNAELPTGTPYPITRRTMETIQAETNAVLGEVEKKAGREIVESISLSIGSIAGSSGPGGATRGQDGSHVGQMIIKLVPSDFRPVTGADIERMLRPRIETLPNLKTLSFISSLVSENPDIELELTHPQQSQLNQAAEALKREIARIEGAVEVDDSFDPGKTEYVFNLTPEGLATGLTATELGRQLRAAFFGLEAQRYQRGRSEIVVYVRYPKPARDQLASLRQMRINLPRGGTAPLESLATIRRQRGYATIETVDGQRVVSVTADADTSVTTPNQILEVIRSEIMPELTQRYQGLSYALAGESKDQKEDLASLGRNMAIALMLIFVLLGSQLRSYAQPFVIMAAIPFGVVGAILGHFFLGYDLTFISMFGIVALTGVVVNDSVVLVDYLNTRNREGTPLLESALEAVQHRFRPILLTTLSTSLGLLPVMLETSVQARFLIPMVVSLAMGILFATPVILVLVPSLVMIVEDIKAQLRRLVASPRQEQE